ncbi:Uncharacterized protein FWK35_00016013 [Aphis craccivora]|uniref:Uncharacterized protein n=1 Tax=Aphis craccivora TaxID=307492 RepID=A0A6G0Y7B6_APHCR|nr:Uncharacterized protein FWK35_00016013 [Aphis craccivora]
MYIVVIMTYFNWFIEKSLKTISTQYSSGNHRINLMTIFNLLRLTVNAVRDQPAIEGLGITTCRQLLSKEKKIHTLDVLVSINQGIKRFLPISPVQFKKRDLPDSEWSDGCIDFTMIITSRNNAPISNYGGGFRCKSEYLWCIIEVKS